MADNEGDAEKERVTAHSYGALDTSDATSECWLIRIPQRLAQLMDAAPEGAELGELVFTKGGKVAGQPNPIRPSLTVHINEEATKYLESNNKNSLADEAPKKSASSSIGSSSSLALPLNYSLQAMTKKIPLMHPFTRNPNTGTVKILGRVTRTANLQVEQDSNYRAMLKERLVATNVTSQRFVKPIGATESILIREQKQQQHVAVATTTGGGRQGPGTAPASTASRGFGAAVLEFGQRRLEAQQLQQQAAAAANLAAGGDYSPRTKKARQFGPGQPIRSILFDLFSQRQYWTVKELKAAAVAGGAAAQFASKRADTDLRDVLKEIGEYHRTGDQKNMWELKKEFQHGGASAS